MPKTSFVYLVAHSYSEGIDSYLVRSNSPSLDVLDLVVSDPSTFEPHRMDEEVGLMSRDQPLQELVDAAPEEARSSFLSSLRFVPKATRAQRAEFLESLSEDELGLSGLSCYSP